MCKIIRIPTDFADFICHTNVFRHFGPYHFGRGQDTSAPTVKSHNAKDIGVEEVGAAVSKTRT